MTKRGDVVLVDFPFTSGSQSKIRPALVVRNDVSNRRLSKTIIALIRTIGRLDGPVLAQIDSCLRIALGI